MLTVFEALLFAARLKIPESIPDTEKVERVNTLLEKLGIEGIRNSRIGDSTGGKARGISGGEMRRVSIGMELIAAPDILILDEPTSGKLYIQTLLRLKLIQLCLGLDSVSAARVAYILREIAHDPVNPIPVVASIHQPRYVIKFMVNLWIFDNRTVRNSISSSTPFWYSRKDMRSTMALVPWLPCIISEQVQPMEFLLTKRVTTLLTTFWKLPVIHLLVCLTYHRKAVPMEVVPKAKSQKRSAKMVIWTALKVCRLL